METYRHDSCNRIKELNRRTYEPDGVTPKLKKSPAVSNNPDAVASYIGETSYYSYDRSGNLLSDGNATYIYDGFGRAAEVKMADGGTQINRYDAEGLRAEMEENGQLVKFLFNEEKEVIVEETNEDVIRYIRGLGIISSDSESARTYYHYVSDNQGSVRLILTDTTNDRRICNYYCYDAFGESIISHEDVHNRFRSNGEQYDPVTSQYYLRARFYNPVIGRFTQEDTYYGDGLNLYEYCRNNPILYRDPSGHDVCPTQYMLYRMYRELGMKPQEAFDQMRLDLGINSSKGSTGGNNVLKTVNIPKSVERLAKKLSPEARRGYDKAIEALKNGDMRGLNDHPLSGNRSGQRAIDIKGMGKGRGAGRIIYEYGPNGEINILEMLTDHRY